MEHLPAIILENFTQLIVCNEPALTVNKIHIPCLSDICPGDLGPEPYRIFLCQDNTRDLTCICLYRYCDLHREEAAVRGDINLADIR
ncbi:MAG: hypothetical protein BWY05_01543 [Euryarchaeota archaeon ADurb.Bin165]|nr:MAG: hypothetical protein BWY05_01543 [Euryarchaeota archaeon ADurb.Bin165]